MRGITQFNKLVSDPKPLTFPKPETNKSPGRSSELIQARNQLLIYRFYYKSRIENKRYPVILSELSFELHLTQIRIQDIIQEESHRIAAVKKQNPPIKYFRDTWSHWTW